MYYLIPQNSNGKLENHYDLELLSALGKTQNWDDKKNGPGTITIQDVFSLLRKRIHELRVEVRSEKRNEEKIQDLHWRIYKLRKGIQLRIDSCIKHEQKKKISLDIDNPYDSLREYLLHVGRVRLFFSQNQEQVEDFMMMLKHVLALVQNKYRQLDRKFWLRDDGSSRFSHAWETLEIILCRYHFYDADMIFAALCHDFLEDVDVEFIQKALRGVISEEDLQNPANHEKYKEISLRISLYNANPDANMIDRVIPMIKAMTKRPLTDYIRDVERNWYTNELQEDERNRFEKMVLKDRRTRDYFGGLHNLTLKTFVVKCADRQHALEHLEWVDEKKARRKIEETIFYFLPELERRCVFYQGRYRNLFKGIYDEMVLTIEHLRVRFSILPSVYNNAITWNESENSEDR